MISSGRLGLGGVHTHLVLLCETLRRHGAGVTLFATACEWPRESIAAMQNLGVKMIVPRRNSSRSAALFSMASWPFYVSRKAVSLYCIGAGNSHRILQALAGRKVPAIYHEIVAPPKGESVAGKCIERSTATVANSRKVARDMSARWPGKPIRAIPFLTSSEKLPAPARRPTLSNTSPLRVVYLGRLVEQKRPDVLVKKWAEIAARPPLAPARLDVWGYDVETGGAMLEELREFVRQGGMQETIEVHGAYTTADLPRILESADVVVLPSTWEGLPLVLVEAMQRGVPIVATAAGGTEELGDDNPDVEITGCEWNDFVEGLSRMAANLRAGKIDARRLHGWTESRYGTEAVSKLWLDCLLQPEKFFPLP